MSRCKFAYGGFPPRTRIGNTLGAGPASQVGSFVGGRPVALLNVLSGWAKGSSNATLFL